MEITEIGRYKLSFDAARFSIECPLGTAKGPLTLIGASI